jgi:hypothetical protein
MYTDELQENCIFCLIFLYWLLTNWFHVWIYFLLCFMFTNLNNMAKEMSYVVSFIECDNYNFWKYFKYKSK